MAKRVKSERFVSRGGDKLDGALADFGVEVRGCIAADLGANVGGFTDCLLRRGAARVYAVDTAYGILDWRLRTDERVVVLERSNALHVSLPEPVDLVAIDAGWTPLRLSVPPALSMTRCAGTVVALLKPQYEAEPSELDGGIVRADCLDEVVGRVVAGLEASGFAIEDRTPSRLLGNGGNSEFFLVIRRAERVNSFETLPVGV